MKKEDIINGILKEFEDVDIYADECYLLDETAEKVADKIIAWCDDFHELSYIIFAINNHKDIEVKTVLFEILRKTFPVIGEKIDEATSW